MKREMFLIFVTLVLIILFVSFAFAANILPELKFEYPSQQTNYKETDSVTILVTATLTGAGKVDNIQYLGVGWAKPDATVYESIRHERCESKTKCAQRFTMPNPASSYKGYEFYPLAWAVLDGKIPTAWINGDSIPISVQNKLIAPPPVNNKPSVTLEVDKTEIFAGDSVVLTVKGTSTDPKDLKSLKLIVPSMGKPVEPHDCKSKEIEKGECVWSFKLKLPDAGTVTIEAEAEDIYGLTSDKASKSVTVKPRVALIAGLNLIKATSDLKGKQIIDNNVFGGIYQCLSPEVGVWSTAGWKRVDLTYQVDANDIAIAIYCAKTTQESLYDPYLECEEFGGC